MNRDIYPVSWFGRLVASGKGDLEGQYFERGLYGGITSASRHTF